VVEPRNLFPVSQEHRCQVDRELVGEPGGHDLASDLTRADQHRAVTGVLSGPAYRVLDAVGAEGVRRVGVPPPPLVRVAMGDDEDVVAHDRGAAPAVDEVEEVTPDQLATDARDVEVVRRLLRHLEHVVGVERELDGAGLVPVEDGSRQVVGTGDVAVERGDGLDNHGGHEASSSYSTYRLITLKQAGLHFVNRMVEKERRHRAACPAPHRRRHRGECAHGTRQHPAGPPRRLRGAHPRHRHQAGDGVVVPRVRLLGHLLPALPDARDGLKPVQRRILYTMNDMGVRPTAVT
jgi:hypothetical protein